jgi:hypothetical protein
MKHGTKCGKQCPKSTYAPVVNENCKKLKKKTPEGLAIGQRDHQKQFCPQNVSIATTNNAEGSQNCRNWKLSNAFNLIKA